MLSPLMKACVDGDAKKVAALLAAGADVNEATAESGEELELLHLSFTVPDAGRTALMIAAGDMGEAHVEVMRLLLAAGARVDAVGEDGHTALCRAAGAGSSEAVALLLAHGADVDQPAMFTPLFCAAELGDLEIVRTLSRRGAEIDAPIWTGRTALMAAKSEAVQRLLLRRGADVTRRDRDRKTALHHAIERSGSQRETPVPFVRALLANGADASARARDGVTPLHLAAGLWEWGYETAEHLIRAGAKIDSKDERGMTPLLRACELDRVDVAVLLLDAGAKVHAKNREGMTPLLVAAKNGYVDLGCVLLSRGARGVPRALALARESGRDDFVRLLNGEDVAAKKLPRAVRELSERARSAYASGDHRRALQLYRRVPPTFRTRIYANVANMGYCYQQLGQNREAAEQLERALTLNPPNPVDLWKALCFCHSTLEEWEAMERCALRAVDLSPNDDYAWQQLAIARSQRGDPRGAIEAGEKAVALAPTNAYALFNLGAEQKKLDLPEALDNLARAVTLAPQLREHLAPEDAAAVAQRSSRS